MSHVLYCMKISALEILLYLNKAIITNISEATLKQLFGNSKGFLYTIFICIIINHISLWIRKYVHFAMEYLFKFCSSRMHVVLCTFLSTGRKVYYVINILFRSNCWACFCKTNFFQLHLLNETYLWLYLLLCWKSTPSEYIFLSHFLYAAKNWKAPNNPKILNESGIFWKNPGYLTILNLIKANLRSDYVLFIFMKTIKIGTFPNCWKSYKETEKREYVQRKHLYD